MFKLKKYDLIVTPIMLTVKIFYKKPLHLNDKLNNVLLNDLMVKTRVGNIFLKHGITF